MLRILQGVCDVFIVMYLYLYVCAWRTLVRVKKNNVFSRLIFDLYIFYMSYAHVISVWVHCLGPIGLRYSLTMQELVIQIYVCVYDRDKNIINAHMSINLKKCFLYLPNEKCIRMDIFPTVKMLYNITMKQK